jgi:hypothetical protein
MVLNRNNYEEYFLMYVDNELSAAERKTLERFLHENPDLRTEMTMLQHTQQKADVHISFRNKQGLLKSEEGGNKPDLTNYLEFFLLYVDRELDPESMLEVEVFADRHPDLKKELRYMVLARLEPSREIIYEPKSRLYRKEKSVRLVWIPRISVAAALLLFVAGTYFFNRSGNSQVRGIASQPQAKRYPPDTLPSEKNTLPVTSPGSGPLYSRSVSRELHPEATGRKTGKKLEEQPDRNPYRSGGNPENPDGQDLVFLRHRSVEGTLADPESGLSGDIATIGPSVKLGSPVLDPGKAPIIRKVDTGLVPLAQTSFHDPESGSENPEFLANASDGKNAMRGLLRKVSRVFEKNTGSAKEDGRRRLRIGGFQIALK